MEGKYYHTKDSVEEYIKLAKDAEGKPLIEKFERVLPLNSELLEIGSGPGTDWKMLSNLYHVTGSDNSTQFLSHLKSENPNGTFLELDAITLNTDSKYDGIYSNKVMHHLNDSEMSASIKRQSEILNTPGFICHSFWKGEGSEEFKGLFVNYYDESKLETVFKEYFNIILIESYKEFEDSDSLILIGRKNNK